MQGILLSKNRLQFSRLLFQNFSYVSLRTDRKGVLERSRWLDDLHVVVVVIIIVVVILVVVLIIIIIVVVVIVVIVVTVVIIVVVLVLVIIVQV